MTGTDPRCVSLLLCDHVIQDKLTNKNSFIGVFNTITCANLPHRWPLLFVVVGLTNCRGKTDLTIDIVRYIGEEEKTLMHADGSIQSKNPRDVIELVLQMQGLPLEAEGEYGLFVKTRPEGKLVAHRFFQVQKSGQPKRD